MTKRLNIVLTEKDGWKFGLGFMAAVFVFSFVLIPAIFCLLALLLSFFGSIFQGLL